MRSSELALYKRGGAKALAAEAERQLAARSARGRRVAPRKAPGREAREAKRKTKAERRPAIRTAVVARADGRCECPVNGPDGIERCPGYASEWDHFWGRAREESVESTWMLCGACHYRKTNNQPGRLAWLARFQFHAREHLYDAQAAKCAAAMALEQAQHHDTCKRAACLYGAAVCTHAQCHPTPPAPEREPEETRR
jgi:hypothetical protein